MALGNWSASAWNIKGKRIPAIMELGGDKVEVELYKNWVYLRDKKAWSKRSDFSKPTIMQINDGDLQYKDIKIISRRYYQRNSIFLIAIHTDWKKDKPKYTGFYGIACYAFNSKGIEEGITDRTYANFVKFLKFCKENYSECEDIILPKETGAGGYNQGFAFMYSRSKKFRDLVDKENNK